MNLRPRWPLALVALLLILLPLLASLQYRWIGQVSEAERERLTNSLHVSTDRFADDFAAAIRGIFAAIQVQGGLSERAGAVSERYRFWESSAAYPQLLRRIYFIMTEPLVPPTLYHLNVDKAALEPVAWPREWQALTQLGRSPPNLENVRGTLGFLIPARPGRPRGPGPPRPLDATSPEGWWLVELSRDVLVNQVLPALAETHFGLHDDGAYRIGVVSGRNSPEIVFSPDGSWAAEDIAMPDAAVDLLPFRQMEGAYGPPQGAGPPFGRPPGRRGRPGPSDAPAGPPLGGNGFGRGAGAGGPPALPLGQPMRLVVKHRLGGLEMAVEQVRRRNLAVSFGILLVLGGGIIAVVASSLRARALGQLQMDFAAGVSHELRTPLAIIQTAAYNLQSGAVRDKKAIDDYATILQDESRRLSDMVNQVLLFAETQSGSGKYDLAPVEVASIVDRAIRNLASAARHSGNDVLADIPPEIPLVLANASALTQCLQNLLSNALKYGRVGETAQIKVVASLDRSRREVEITVADQGPGITPADRSRLFEPFYRGRINSNIPGNGLGLHLVKRLMESQAGRVTFKNNLTGNGASFTLHLRAVDSDG